MFHNWNFFASLLHSSGSFRTNIEVCVGGEANCSLSSTLPIPSEWLTSAGTINLNHDCMTAERNIHSKALWFQRLDEATSSFLWPGAGAMWNYLFVLKIAFCKIRVACIYIMGKMVRDCEMSVLITKCEQVLLIMLAGRQYRPPDPNDQLHLL